MPAAGRSCCCPAGWSTTACRRGKWPRTRSGCRRAPAARLPASHCCTHAGAVPEGRRRFRAVGRRSAPGVRESARPWRSSARFRAAALGAWPRRGWPAATGLHSPWPQAWPAARVDRGGDATWQGQATSRIIPLNTMRYSNCRTNQPARWAVPLSAGCSAPAESRQSGHPAGRRTAVAESASGTLPVHAGCSRPARRSARWRSQSAPVAAGTR